MELAILVDLTKRLRDNTLSKGVPKPSKVVHVGHSYGSMLSSGLAATAGELSDGIVLTGFSNINQYMQWFAISTGYNIASLNQPDRLGSLASGYLTWSNEVANQYDFFKYPYFEPGVLSQAESTKWAFTIGEFLSGVPTSGPDFDKPVLVSLARPKADNLSTEPS